MVGNQSPEVPAKLRVYEQWIQQVLAAARAITRRSASTSSATTAWPTATSPCSTSRPRSTRSPADGAGLRRGLRLHHGALLVLQRPGPEADHRRPRAVPQGRIVPDEELRSLHACSRTATSASSSSSSRRACSSSPATWANAPSAPCTATTPPTPQLRHPPHQPAGRPRRRHRHPPHLPAHGANRPARRRPATRAPKPA
jgi:hypothetical protein